MTRTMEKKLIAIFKNYNANQKALKENSDFPHISAVDFGRISVQSDKSRNVQEEKIASFMDKKANLMAQVWLVDEVLRWFTLEGHGRERFVKMYFIDGASWIKVQMQCNISNGSMGYWRTDVLEKAEMVAKWYQKELGL